MLDNIERLAWSYVHDYARVVHSVCEENISLNFLTKKGKYGDIIDHGYDIYVYINGEWSNLYHDFHIWHVNPDTGYFIFSDYWERCYLSNRYILVFNHKPYLNELLNNIGWELIDNKIILSTFAYIKGLKCTIYVGHVKRSSLGRHINVFQQVLQNSDKIYGSYYTTTAYRKSDIPLTASPLSMYTIIGLDDRVSLR